jgi:hypothetical protein
MENWFNPDNSPEQYLVITTRCSLSSARFTLPENTDFHP